jgi:dephospho-CoA kinase
MIIIGLTGGIGSGKTTVAKLFLERGVPVYFADDEAKKLMQSSEALKSKIRATFGDKSYLNNTLNRSYLAALVFTDKRNLERLNKLVHPAVKEHFSKWRAQQNSEYVIYENAILFESNSDKECDYIITVIADYETRIKRVMKRDNISRQDVINRIDNQLKTAEKVALSDAVIQNDDLQNLKPQINKILVALKNKFSSN